jgi:hypothetical protein
MNTARILTLCGKKKGGRDARGVKAMDLKQIDQFIKNEAPQNVKNYYTTLQKKNRGRIDMCKILARFKKGEGLLKSGGTPSPKRKTPPAEQDPLAIMAQSNFELMTQIGKVDQRASRGSGTPSNRNSNWRGSGNGSNGEVYGYGSGNNSNGGERRAKANQRANWTQIRRAEPDPFAKEIKLKGRTKATIERKMRQLERKGELPKAATRANLMKAMIAKTPAALRAAAGPHRLRRVSTSSPNSSASPATRRRKFDRRRKTKAPLKMGSGNPRVVTRPRRKLPLRIHKQRSKLNVRNAWTQANVIMNAGRLPRRKTRSSSASASPNFQGPNYPSEGANYNRVRAQVMERVLLKKPPMRTPSPGKPSFNMMGDQVVIKRNNGGGVETISLNVLAKRIEGKKVANRTLNEKSILRKYKMATGKKGKGTKGKTTPELVAQYAEGANLARAGAVARRPAAAEATPAERRRNHVVQAVVQNMGPRAGGGVNLNAIIKGMSAMPKLSKEEVRKLQARRKANQVTIRGVGRGARGWASHGAN